MSHNHQRGAIKHNAMAALVTSPMFRGKQEQQKKGKGSYSRKSIKKISRENGKVIACDYFSVFLAT